MVAGNSLNPPASRATFSVWSAAAVYTAFVAFIFSTNSPFSLILPILYTATFLLSYRFARDAGAIWGVRLLLYAGFALLGRTPTGPPGYYIEVQAFTTVGLIAGAELILQAFRVPPTGAQFDPWIVATSSVLFLIACNTNRPHIWILAPLYIFFLLFSLTDLRPGAVTHSLFGKARRLLFISLAVALGAVLHQTIWSYRNAIMVAGARLLPSSAASVSAGGTQLTDTPELSSSVGAGTSTARLIRISGGLNDPHLRAATFDIYKEGKWGPAMSQRKVDSALPDQTREEDHPGHDAPRNKNNAKITVLRDSGGVLFAPLNSWAIMPELGQSFDWDRFQGPFKTEEPPPVTYYVTDSKTDVMGMQTTQGPLCVAPNFQQRAELLQIPPEIDPRVTQLARQVARQGTTPTAKAQLVTDYLFKNNKYSLEFTRGTQDPVSDFVLNKRAAHCQYFASAAVMMLRAVGIPARYVSGFYAHETDSDGNTIVRGRDAHAWAEAYLQGIGWVTLDATPPAGRADPNVNPLPFYQRWLESAQDTFSRIRAWFGSLTNFQMMEMVGVIILLWSLERWRQSRQKARRRARGPVPPPELAPLARRFERILAKRGITLLQSRPWSESLPSELQEERDWIAGYNRARFDEVEDEELRELESQLTELEKAKVSQPKS